MRRIYAIIALLGLCTGAGAQNAWTLERCIDYALEHNITLKQSEITVDQREIDLNTAENRRLPGVSASSSQNFSFGRGLTADNTYANTNTTSTSFSLGADVPIFQGFAIKNNIELSRLNLAAATADLDKARDDIRVAVAQSYVQILYDMEMLDVAEAQTVIDKEQVARLEEMQRQGKASGAEVSAQRASLAQSELSATQAANALQLAILDLTQLLELQSPEGFTIVRPSLEAFEPGILLNPEQIYAEAVEVKPAVLSEKIRLDYALKNIDLARGNYLPTLSLSGGLGSNFYTSTGYEHKGFGSQIKDNFSQYLGLSLSLPIFSRYSTRNSIRSARLSADSQELQLESAKKSLYKEIQQAYYNAVASQSKFESSRIAADSAFDAFELMQAKYENGKASITEFNESKNRYVTAQSDLVQAQYEYLYQTRLLDFYRGKDIVF